MIAKKEIARAGQKAGHYQDRDNPQNIEFVLCHARPPLRFANARSASTPAATPPMTAAIKPRRKGKGCPIQAMLEATSRHRTMGRVFTIGISTASRARMAAKFSDQLSGTKDPR